MKRSLLLLLPWMVAVAAAQDALRPAEINLTHLGSAAAWRQGNECYISPRALIDWKWPYSFVGNEATIQAEGRTIRVMGTSINTRFLLPMNQILDQLGATYAWHKDRDAMDIVASVRAIKVKDGVFTTDSTLSVQPIVTWMDEPGRVVVDLKGAKLADNAVLELDPLARAEQLDPTTVRIVLQTDLKPLVPIFVAGRTFEWSLTAPPALDATPITVTPKIEPVKIAVVPPMATLSSVEVLNEGGSGAKIVMKTSVALPSPAQLRRVDPLTLEIDLPKVGRPETLVLPKSASFTTFEATQGPTATTIRLVTERPMGVKLSAIGNQISLELFKPKVGDGKLAGKVIVVDAGHGDHDSGAKAPDKSVFEKNLTLAISKQVAAELTSNGATVIMTRDSDAFIALKERAEIANRSSAAFFVSVHINSNRTANTTSGTISFYHGGSVTGQLLAECIQNELKQIYGMPGIGVWSDTRIYSTGFAVLRYSKMPAVLLELGFINHSADRKRMQQRDYHTSVAKAVVKGLRVYLGDVKP